MFHERYVVVLCVANWSYFCTAADPTLRRMRCCETFWSGWCGGARWPREGAVLYSAWAGWFSFRSLALLSASSSEKSPSICSCLRPERLDEKLTGPPRLQECEWYVREFPTDSYYPLTAQKRCIWCVLPEAILKRIDFTAQTLAGFSSVIQLSLQLPAGGVRSSRLLLGLLQLPLQLLHAWVGLFHLKPNARWASINYVMKGSVAHLTSETTNHSSPLTF